MTSLISEPSVQELIQAAERAVTRGEVRAALGYLIEAQAHDAQNGELALALGHVKLNLQDLPGALEQYEAAVRLLPNLPSAVAARALALQLCGRASEAEVAAFEALRLKPTEPVALKVLARIGLDRGERDATEKICRRLLALHPGDPDATQMLEQLRASAARAAAAPVSSAGLGHLFGSYTERVQAWETIGPEHLLHQFTVGDYSSPVETVRVEAPVAVGSDGYALPPVALTMGYGAGNLDHYLRCGSDSYRVLSGLLRDHGVSLDGGDALLDWGCAAGRAVRFFNGEATRGCEIWGGDVHAPSIRWAQQHLSPPFRFFNCSSLPHLPFRDGKFKVIYGLSVMTHLINLRDLWLLELGRVLAPDGCLILTIHNEDTWDYFRQKGMPAWMPAGLQKAATLPGDCLEIRGSRWDQCYTFFSSAHVRKVWGQFFEIAEVRPCADCYQSAVILRHRR